MPCRVAAPWISHLVLAVVEVALYSGESQMGRVHSLGRYAQLMSVQICLASPPQQAPQPGVQQLQHTGSPQRAGSKGCTSMTWCKLAADKQQEIAQQVSSCSHVPTYETVIRAL